MSNNCPCGSRKSYQECCGPYHDGKIAEDALTLMKARYAAYACYRPEYIIQTTHLKSPQYQIDNVLWAKEIEQFSKNTVFEGLKIVDYLPGETRSTVHFIACLKQGDRDVSFKEESIFEKVHGRWFYLSGKTQSVPRF